MPIKKWIVSAVGVAAISGLSYWGGTQAKSGETAKGEAAKPAEAAPNAGGGGRSGAQGAGGRPTSVSVAVAKKADVRIVQQGLGTVVPRESVVVRSRVDGQLTKVLFSEGELVKAGQVLAKIDARPFQAALDQALGQAARNQALLKNAELDLARYRALRAQDSIAAQQVDTQEALVQQYQGTVQADKGLVDNAKLQLGFTKIVAPISGRIGLRLLDAGNNISSNDANGLAVINAVQPAAVVFTVPEDQVTPVLQRWRKQREEGGKLGEGQLASLDNQIDPTTGTIKLKAQFSNDDGRLFPNQFVNVRLVVDTVRDVVTVPNTAIQRGSIGTFVYVVQPDKDAPKSAAKPQGGEAAAKPAPPPSTDAPKRPDAAPAGDGPKKDGEKREAPPPSVVSVRNVKLGPVDGENIAVSEGLQPGEVVVTGGTDRLREGAKVIPTFGGGKGRGGKPEAAPADGKPLAESKEGRPGKPDAAEAGGQERKWAGKPGGGKPDADAQSSDEPKREWKGKPAGDGEPSERKGAWAGKPPSEGNPDAPRRERGEAKPASGQ